MPQITVPEDTSAVGSQGRLPSISLSTTSSSSAYLSGLLRPRLRHPSRRSR